MLRQIFDSKGYISIKVGMCLLPIALYFAVLYVYALNLPTMDDYAAILDFLHYFKLGHGIGKAQMLLAQHGEHRILSSRLFYTFYEMLPGEINFRTIVLVGNLQLLTTYLILVYFIRRYFPQSWAILSFVAALFLFDLSNWENAHFAMASMQNYGILFLFSTCIFFYAQRSYWSLIPALLAQVICIFSSGNGIIGSAFVVLFCMIERSRPRVILSLIVTLIFSPLYFMNYNASIKAQPSSHYVNMAAYFFRLFSGHIHCPDHALKVVLGAILFIVSLVVFPVRKYMRIDKEDGFFISMFGFVMATMVLTSVYRSSLGDLPPSRYLIYPHYMAVLIFIFALKKIRSEKATRFAMITAVIGVLNYIPSFEYGLKDFAKVSDIIRSTDYDYPDKEIAKTIAERCCAEGIYCIERHRIGR
ncbi:MAG: hypothetical protein KF744_01715 [Taibaiella sp.]|nr:hypothetical protein [Taibaiella sp.]